jgi:hypothetical protein
MAIDWGFIAKLEGASNCGYVPDASASRSGVTIASGVDLSAENDFSIRGLPDDLRARLRPYLGLTGAAALAALRDTPLALTDNEVATLNAYVDGHAALAIQRAYNAMLGGVGGAPTIFADLPAAAQTVIASVAFQYGDLARRCPNFWSRAVAQDWAGCIAELRNFGDRYDTRRHKEADYLAAGI